MFHSRVVDHAMACEEIHGKQTVMQTSGTADASLTSHESTSLSCVCPFVLTDAESASEEPHRDAIPFDPALGQSELPPVVSLDTFFNVSLESPRD